MTLRTANIALAIALICICAVPAAARRATSKELRAFSQEAANDTRLGRVGIGAGFIEGGWAIASWRGASGKRRGQAVFFHMCDHWNLAETSTTSFTASRLAGVHRVVPLSPQIAARLEADSIQL